MTRKIGRWKLREQEDRFEDVMLPSPFREAPRTPGRCKYFRRKVLGTGVKGGEYRNLIIRTTLYCCCYYCFKP